MLRPVAERLKLPYPILLLVFGLLFAFVPALPRLDISPDLILPLVLPPLLFAAARRTSLREFLDNRRAGAGRLSLDRGRCRPARCRRRR